MSLIILFGPPGVVIAAPFEAVAAKVGRRKIDYLGVTNAARFVVIYWTCAKVYDFLAPVAPQHMDLSVLAGTALATLVCYVMVVALISVSTKLRKAADFRSILAQHYWLAPHYAVLGLLGAALATAYMAIGFFGVVAFAAPALMIRVAMKQYTDKTRENVQKLTSQNAALQQANVEIRRVSDELRGSYDGTLEALVNALDARDQETKGHSLRVSHYMMDIARELGVEPGTQQWIDMQRGSLLHDVGKIGVSDTILLKPAKLTDDEWQFMRRHPEIGYNMLRQVKFLQGAAEIVLAHHERWDGKGYPYGLREDEIPLGARIFAVVDTFDSMTSDRPYRQAKSTVEAMNEILKYNGAQFDPLVVEAFLDIYETWVKQRNELHDLVAAKLAA
jgi:putative nucleotidyltransferase with HDIG domain